MRLFKHPWVFWVSVKREFAFGRVYAFMGINFLAIYGFGFRVSIGIPWKPWLGTYSEDANKRNAKEKPLAVTVDL